MKLLTSRRQIVNGLMGLLAGFLTVMAVLASVFYFVRVDPDEALRPYPVVTGGHSVLGAIYAGFAAFQFVGPIRRRWPGYHRRTGRLMVAIGLVVGATAVWMIATAAEAQWWDRLIIGFFAMLFLASLVKGFVAIRAQQIATHREWMMRAFAIALGIATMRLIFIPAVLIWRPTSTGAAALALSCFIAAFTLHLAAVELWIRSTRAR